MALVALLKLTQPCTWRLAFSLADFDNRDHLYAACTKILNPAHGSGWIGSGRFYRHLLKPILIPPTAVGGYFKSFLRKEFEQSTNYRWWDSNSSVCISFRKYLNDPPTAVGGISGFLCKAFVRSNAGNGHANTRGPASIHLPDT